MRRVKHASFHFSCCPRYPLALGGCKSTSQPNIQSQELVAASTEGIPYAIPSYRPDITDVYYAPVERIDTVDNVAKSTETLNELVHHTYVKKYGKKIEYTTIGSEVVDGDMLLFPAEAFQDHLVSLDVGKASVQNTRLDAQGAFLKPASLCYAGYCNGWAWPNGKIYYDPTSFMNWPQNARSVVIQSMNAIENRTDIDFVAGTSNRNYITFRNADDGCYSRVGMVGGPQVVNLDFPNGPRDRTCLTNDTVIHELLHAAGMILEHERANRANFITVNWNNLTEKGKEAFKVYEYESATPYDYSSIMHYESAITDKDFVKDVSKPAFWPKNISLVPRNLRMSPRDVISVNTRY